jgi:tRNA (guanine-N7-)-methyltransferase
VSFDPTTVQLEVAELQERGLADCLGAGERVLELGFGRGELILALAEAQPERRFLGVEISRKRVAKLARRVERLELPNVRLLHSTAELVVERALPAGQIDECWINCPDPWPKKRHHRRRLFQPAFVDRLARVLRPGAILHASTDDAPYAQWIGGVLSAGADLENLHAPAEWADEPPDRPVTAYEREWLALGRRIAYFEYRRLPEG